MILTVQAPPPTSRIVDAVTFADRPDRLYIPLKAVELVGTQADVRRGAAFVGGKTIPVRDTKSLPDGTLLVSASSLRNRGFILNARGGGLTSLKLKTKPGSFILLRKGQKRVIVNKTAQTMVAFQGERKVLTTRVSTGREGKTTPTGVFKAQAYKSPFHRSTLYNDAPMPWAVQIVGNIFIHGFKSVPGPAASSGCIRVPLTGRNPARWFYSWIEPGVPVGIQGTWPAGALAPVKKKSS